ncbi:hypothetical protein [Calycomorphotria hydatis]|uniref:Uncharacterized protein n=1 Tax=Calycomorphotria hydatis TaxID=2528027 RepID=A0A517TEM9_9PLAN|nr:hypothetical protein [Calycomorphotria hydatis]QDT66824.1 hypothetical protein V22_40960 [Calycomorphotria hydatis]
MATSPELFQGIDDDQDDRSSLPFSVDLTLTLRDPEVIRELLAHDEGHDREQYAAAALRLGILALRQAQGQVDALAVRNEGERLVKDVQHALNSHREHVDRSLTETLKNYFDPNSGHLQQRIERLVAKDGELESLLSKTITGEHSQLTQRLEAHLGEHSPLMKELSPEQSAGFLNNMRQTLEGELKQQRETILREFSLDQESSALKRLVEEVTDRNGKLRSDFSEKVAEMMRQFSFDEENSALSRMAKTVQTTNDAIHKHLTLDDDNSALSRLRKEMLKLQQEQVKQSRDFQEEVKVAIHELKAREEERKLGTQHGHDFEAALYDCIRHYCAEDTLVERTGNTTGLIKQCKKGDYVVTFGPDHAAAGCKVVVEAKQEQNYAESKALLELEEAKKNREAEIGLFVYSARTAPEETELFKRVGNDLIVKWDAEEATTDLVIQLALSVATALSTRKNVERNMLAVDFNDIDRAILEIAKQIDFLDEINNYADNIQKNSDKVVDRLRKSRKSLQRQATILDEQIQELKHTVSSIETN